MHPRMAARLPLESEAGTQSRPSLRSCWLGTHDGHGGSGSVRTWWLKEAPMKIPFPPSSPDPGADGMLVGGICQLVVFPSTGTPSAPAPAAQGASPTPGTGGVCIPPAAALPPLCHQLPPKCYFNQQQQPGPCRIPGWELRPSGRRDGTRAGGL